MNLLNSNLFFQFLENHTEMILMIINYLVST